MRREEILRKLLHLAVLVIPFLIYYLPKDQAVRLLLPAAGIFFAIEFARMHLPGLQRLFHKYFGMFLRPHEKDAYTGALFFMIAASACLLFFSKEIAFLSLTFILLGDAAAALVGMNFGKIRIGKKTLEGSLACVAVCLVWWLFFPVGIAFPRALAAALLTSVLELLSIKIDDNLLVPVVTGAFLQFVFQ